MPEVRDRDVKGRRTAGVAGLGRTHMASIKQGQRPACIVEGSGLGLLGGGGRGNSTGTEGSGVEH